MLLNRLPLAMLPPRAILLAADVILLLLPKEADAEARFLSGREPPYGTVAVQSVSATYQIAAMRLSDYRAAPGDPSFSFTFDPTQEADQIDPFNTIVLGSDIAELADELDQSSQRRLLAFLLGFCCKAFTLAANSDFAASCRRLAELCTPRFGIAELAATVTRSWMVVGIATELSASNLFLVGADSVRRSAAPLLPGFPALRLVERVAPGDLLLVQGEQPGHCIVGPTRPNLPDLIRSSPDAAGLRAACVRALSPVCPRVSAQLREAALLTPAAPRRHDDISRPVGGGLEAALPDGEGRLFLRGWIRDPMRLVASIELAGPHGAATLERNQLHWFRRPDLAKHYVNAAFADGETQLGFVAFVDDPCAGQSLQPALVLRLHSGARIELRSSLRQPDAATARAAILTSVPPDDVTDAMLDDCIGPAASAFHRRTLEQRGAPDVIQIGEPSRDPAVSVIVPLYRNLSFLRFQLASFAHDPECRATELIFVLDSPEQRHEAEHLLRGLQAMHGLPLTLLVMPRNLGYAAANNAGAAYARAPALLLLNSDVVPAGPSWLGKLTAALAQPGVGAVGPKLLFDDESLQHAGLFFQRDLDGLWLNAHYYKGLPRNWCGATYARRVPGVTGAALLVHRQLFQSIGGICEDYIVGDYEDSDFCLRLHATGARILYEPAAELFHFERRSIGLHKGYAGTLACRYNRRLHHRRWSEIIATLMAEPEFDPDAVGANA